MLIVQDLRVEIESKEILRGVSMGLEAGSCTCIVGPNGAGKSTLLRALAGVDIASTSGKIMLSGRDISEMSSAERFGLGMLLTYQSPPAIEGLTVIQLLRAVVPEFDTSALVQAITDAAKELGLPDDLYKRVVHQDLSGGQKKLLELLQAMIIQPKLLLCDEIDSGLDVTKQALVAKILTRLNKDGMTLLCVTHSLKLAQQLNPDTVLVLDKGAITQTGDVSLLATIDQHGFATHR
jgi:Fe-S cluster assembly ATP-binding protein